MYLKRERISARACNKLKSKKYGPFKIVKKISDNTYVVDLSSDMAMSKTFKWRISMNITLSSSYIQTITRGWVFWRGWDWCRRSRQESNKVVDSIHQLSTAWSAVVDILNACRQTDFDMPTRELRLYSLSKHVTAAVDSCTSGSRKLMDIADSFVVVLTCLLLES